MKNTFLVIALFSAVVLLNSCKKEEDEGKLPVISFKTTSGYISKDTTIDAADMAMIGIYAYKAESADVLKKFNISRSRNGGAAVSLIDSTLTGSQADTLNYMYMASPDTASGATMKYTFTVTNRDGLTNSVSLTLTTD